MDFSYFTLVSLASIGILAILLALVLFEPGLDYRTQGRLGAIDAADFFRAVAAATGGTACRIDACRVLDSGPAIYAAELDAIRRARRSIHIEAFIFHADAVGRRFLAALTERAQAGVTVRVLVDAVGSMLTPDAFFAPLRAAGGTVVWYQPLRWYTLKRYNNRTHRELIVIDGERAFVGGAGIATHWAPQAGRALPWRDTMLRLRGDAATSLQAVLAENWLEATGEILVETDDRLPAPEEADDPAATAALVVASSPTEGRASHAHVLLQLLIAAAQSEILINSPYFLPDRALRRELLQAAARGVRVRIIVPGRGNNHPLTRYASRRHYGELLSGGIAIHEYQPAMIHAKILVVDRLWSVLGSTNFDSRSLALNDEVNLAVRSETLALRLARDFERDLCLALPVDLPAWMRRPMGERMAGVAGLLLERQE